MAEYVGTEISSVNLDKKKAAITDNLQKREEDRLLEIHKRREEKDSVSAKNERADFYDEKFSQAIIEAEEGLQKSNTVAKSELVDHFDGLATSVQQIQKFVSDSTFFLSAHKVQRSQEAIGRIVSSIQEKRDELIPKKKFAFKSKKKAADKPKNPALDNVDNKTSNKIHVELTEVRFTDKTGETLSMSTSEIQSSDVALARLTDCTVKLLGSPSTVHVNNLRNCTILCGPVSSSIFVDDCLDCIFVVACQQLRVHSTKDSTFYLHVTSRAIIEDSNSLNFAPYNLMYTDLDDHYANSGLDRTRNTWNDVDDFNWLASDAHSPNWRILEEPNRKNTWDI